MVQKVRGMAAKQEMNTPLIVLAGFFISRKKKQTMIALEIWVFTGRKSIAEHKYGFITLSIYI